MTVNDEDAQLQSAIANLYRGKLEDFVRQRDALAKELRSEGKRDAASIVKNVRKPSRLAWVLDQTVLDDTAAIDALAAAVGETLDAQHHGGDIRETIVRLRAAVREFAGVAVRVAEHAGYAVESGTVANAVLAIVGNPESFSQLRRGVLVEIPEGAGIDFFAAVAPKDQAEPESKPRETARKRVEVSQRALRDAETKLEAAEKRLRDAEEEVRVARMERDRAREDIIPIS